MKENNKRLYNLLIWSCFIFYNATLVCKNIFTAQIVNITAFLGVEKAEAQLCSTYYFFPYAIGQLLIVPFVKNMDLKKALVITMVLSSVAVGSMAFANSLAFFYAVHAVNGALHVLTWVAVLYLCSKYLPSDMIQKANKLLSFGFASGVALAYAIAAFFSAIDLWRGTFILGGALTLLTVLFLAYVVRQVEKLPRLEASENSEKTEDKDVEEKKHNNYSINGRVILFYAVDIIGCLLVYAVYYSIMPNVTFLFTEVFNMDPSLSILITVCFPVFISFGSIFMIQICERFNRYFLVSSLFDIIAGAIALILVFTYEVSFLLAMILLILILFLCRGASSVLGTIVILDLRKQINTGRFSAINNAFGCITASVMPPVMAMIIPNGNPDWKLFFIVCTLLCVVTSAFMFAFDMMFKKKKGKEGAL